MTVRPAVIIAPPPDEAEPRAFVKDDSIIAVAYLEVEAACAARGGKRQPGPRDRN